MYVVKVYEEDNGGFLLVGQLKGKFLTYEDCLLTIKNQNRFIGSNFSFRIVELDEK